MARGRSNASKEFGVRNLPLADPVELAKAIEDGLLPRVPSPDALDHVSYAQKRLQDGDLVTLFGGYDDTATTTIVAGNRHSNRLGDFQFDDMIGGEMGMKVWDKMKKKWMALLPPSPEMHMHTLRHRTQILYTSDMSYSIMQMGLKNGSRVVESGTGSGAMSYFLSRAVGEQGRVFTFEYHPSRYSDAVDDCKLLKLNKQLRNFERNAYRDGFEVNEQDAKSCCEKVSVEFEATKDIVSEDNQVDAVFLDLPEPWQALDHADKILQDNGVIVVFSPCVEQVLKVCQNFENRGWDAHMEVVENINFTWSAKVFGQGRMANGKRTSDTTINKDAKKPKLNEQLTEESITAESDLTSDMDLLPSARVNSPCRLDRTVPVEHVWPNLTPTPGHTGFLVVTRKAVN